MVVSANDAAKVARQGAWVWNSHRYAKEGALATNEDGAELRFDFQGQCLVLCLDTLTPPNEYGPPELGLLEVFIDGKRHVIVRPRVEDRDVVLLRSAATESHAVRIVHRADGRQTGCRINGFRMMSRPAGDLALTLSGEQNGALIDVRATVSRGGQVVRDVLCRNWLTGQVRLAGLPAASDYIVELRASGWVTRRIENVTVVVGKEQTLAPVFLRREWDVPEDSFRFPAFGRAVVRLPTESFRVRFRDRASRIERVRMTRRQGPATISRVCPFVEDKAAAYYFHREGTVTLPKDVPEGAYDLEITLAGPGTVETILISRRCVTVVHRLPEDPLMFSFGHLDTWGQHQAEYLSRMVELANIVAPDVVLISNEANPAYVAGALYGLEAPFVVNFGGHRGPEPRAWFGESVGVLDFGSRLTILNFGRTWDTGTLDADALLSERAAVPCKVINAFEPNAPIEFLDRHRIALIHDAHGPGPDVMTLGAGPTLRVGKANSASFRVLRFKGDRPVSYTYKNQKTAPIPFGREAPLPLRLSYDFPNDGSAPGGNVHFINELDEQFTRARAFLVLRKGAYLAEGGTIDAAIDSDDGRFTVLTVRFDVAPRSEGVVRVRPEASKKKDEG